VKSPAFTAGLFAATFCVATSVFTHLTDLTDLTLFTVLTPVIIFFHREKNIKVKNRTPLTDLTDLTELTDLTDLTPEKQALNP
jgi:hypothetical protein